MPEKHERVPEKVFSFGRQTLLFLLGTKSLSAFGLAQGSQKNKKTKGSQKRGCMRRRLRLPVVLVLSEVRFNT